jgi:two-component system, OmpR family, alkaline phosphatase synthesis response regulator PhoP
MDKLSRRVLVIEDVAQVADLLRYLLEGEGFEVTVAGSAAAGRAALGAMAPAALVLLDAGLPDGDGTELLAAIRADGAWHAVPVLMLSAATDEGTVMRALAAGANDYLVKPFQPWELLDQVRRVLG